MKRSAAAMTMLAALGGCMAPNTAQYPNSTYTRAGVAREVPGVVGAWNQPIPVKADGTAATGGSVVPVVVRGAADDGVVPAIGSSNSSGGVKQTGWTKIGGATGPEPPRGETQGLLAKKAERKRTGQVPPPPHMGPPGQVAAVAGQALVGGMPMMGTSRSSIRFVGQDGMQIGWFSPTPDGRADFVDQITTPGRYNFLQGGIYRLRLTNIPKRQNVPALYPTIEVIPQNQKTTTFLAHSAIPLSFTDDDFEQVASGNFVVKVIYLPDPSFQELATGLPDEVVSTKLDPGVDPIQEAQRRGSVLLIVRLGNIDLESKGTPAMDAPNPYLRPPMPPMPHMGPAPRGPKSGSPLVPLPPKPSAELPMPTPSGSVVLP